MEQLIVLILRLGVLSRFTQDVKPPTFVEQLSISGFCNGFHKIYVCHLQGTIDHTLVSVSL